MFAKKFSFAPLSAPPTSQQQLVNEALSCSSPVDKRARVRFVPPSSAPAMPATSPRPQPDRSVQFLPTPLIQSFAGLRPPHFFFFPVLSSSDPRVGAELSRELLSSLDENSGVVVESYARVDRVLSEFPTRIDLLLCAPSSGRGSAVIVYFYKQSPCPDIVPGATYRFLGRPRRRDLFQAFAILEVSCAQEIECAALRAKLGSDAREP